jgi:hypothetical protein
MAFTVTLDKAIYLDLVFKITTKVCLWFAQDITTLANKKQNPKVEWHVFLLLAQLVSKNPNNMWPSFCLWHWMPISKVPLM